MASLSVLGQRPDTSAVLSASTLQAALCSLALLGNHSALDKRPNVFMNGRELLMYWFG
jgi:hypothetical protein